MSEKFEVSVFERFDCWFSRFFPRFLDSLLPKEIRGVKNDETESLRMLASFIFFYVLVIFCNILQYVNIGLHLTALLNIVCESLAIGALILIRFFAAYRSAAFVTQVSGFVNVLGGIFITGGPHSPILAWAVASPFISSFILGIRVGAITAVFNAIACLFIFFLDPVKIGLQYEEFPSEYSHIIAAYHYILASIFFLLLAFLYSRRSSRMLNILHERNISIAAIVNHVKSGFLMIDSLGIVQSGYSRICRDMFGKEIAGLQLANILCADQRNVEHFKATCDQVFSQMLPRKVALAMFHEFYHVNKKDLRMQSDVVEKEDGTVDKILLTFVDATAYLSALEKEKSQKMLLSVISQRELFHEFVLAFRQNYDFMLAALKKQNITEVRSILHTIKGNASVLGLSTLVEMIHHIESEEKIDNSHLFKIKIYLDKFSQSFRQTLGEQLEDMEHFAGTLSQEKLDLLQNFPSDLKNSEFLEHIHNWIWQVRTKPIFTLLRFYSDFVSSLAEELGKSVQYKISGTDVSIDAKIWRVLNQHLPTLMRNAIYHGIELPAERGDKKQIGLLEIRVEQKMDNLLLVSVIDDGRGIDLFAIKRKLITSGVMDEEGCNRLSDYELFRYVFESGFSTLDKADTHAGRGFGVSASKQALEEMGATLQLESIFGQGSNFKITLDLKKMRGKSLL